MTLIDTSAWIEFFRRSGNPDVKGRVASYLDASVAAVCGPIEFELLVGARASERGDISTALSFCTVLDFSGACWRRAADVERALRQKGVTVPRDDIFVAAASVEHAVPLFAHDAHFELMRTKGDLKLQLL